MLPGEDENSIRHSACEFLKNCECQGHRSEGWIAAVRTCRQALETSRLVADVVMTGLNGGHSPEILLAKRAHLKALFMSGHAEKALLSDKIVGLHTNFLHKPFTLQSLARKIRGAKPAPVAAATGD